MSRMPLRNRHWTSGSFNSALTWRSVASCCKRVSCCFCVGELFAGEECDAEVSVKAYVLAKVWLAFYLS